MPTPRVRDPPEPPSSSRDSNCTAPRWRSGPARAWGRPEAGTALLPGRWRAWERSLGPPPTLRQAWSLGDGDSEHHWRHLPPQTHSLTTPSSHVAGAGGSCCFSRNSPCRSRSSSPPSAPRSQAGPALRKPLLLNRFCTEPPHPEKQFTWIFQNSSHLTALILSVKMYKLQPELTTLLPPSQEARSEENPRAQGREIMKCRNAEPL